MYTSNIRFVPWKNKDEWEDVYKKAYSSDSQDQKLACSIMDLWLLLRNDAPPGIECTVSLLKVLLKENSTDGTQVEDFQLMFSTALLRVVNLVCDNGRKSGKETLYQVAEYFCIPDWIINLRHDIAHNKTLPGIPMLRMAAKFLLNWLKEFYWEIEKQELRDIVIKRSREDVLRENIFFYLESYCELWEWKRKGNTTTSNLAENIKCKLMNMKYHSVSACISECLPWIVPASAYIHSVNSMPLSKYLDDVLLQILKEIKQYIKESSLKTDTVAEIVNFLQHHFSKQEGIDRDMWNLLIQKLNQWELLDEVMIEWSRLVVSCGGGDEAGSSWLLLLAESVDKRLRVAALKEMLVSPHNNFSDQLEVKLAKKILLRKRLNLRHISNTTVFLSLFGKIEKKFPRLKACFRLKDPVQYLTDNCSVEQMITTIISCPNSKTVNLLNKLFTLMVPQYPRNTKKQLISLVRIYLGEKISWRQNSNEGKVMTLPNLLYHSLENEKKDSKSKSTFFKYNWESVNTINNTLMTLQPSHHDLLSRHQLQPFIFPFS